MDEVHDRRLAFQVDRELLDEMASRRSATPSVAVNPVRPSPMATDRAVNRATLSCSVVPSRS
jgi:hypothetical protein